MNSLNSKKCKFGELALLNSTLEADRFFLFLLWAHLPFSGFILTYSYGTWVESSIASLILCLTGTISYIFSKGTFAHRILNTLLLISFSVILISGQLGRIEMHFHVFGALAFLLLYKDWRIFIPAAGLVSVHHAVFNYCQTAGIKIFGMSTFVFNYGTGWDIVLLHAGMVVFESSILIYYAIIFKRQFIHLTSAANYTALGEMASGIAHEINNPLQIISGNVRFIKRLNDVGEYDREKINSKIESVDKTIVRITKIVNALRVVSRDGTNEKKEMLPLRPILEDTLELSLEKLKELEIKLIIDWENPLFDTELKLLRVQLSQVFVNLLSNSFDAIQSLDEKWIEIKLHQNDYTNNIVLQFIDSGPGIPIELQNKIFNPFFTTKEVGKGTGLGLSLCKNIISKLDGELYIDNNNPHTCITFEFPFSKVQEKIQVAS